MLIILAIILGAVLGTRKTSYMSTTKSKINLEFINISYILLTVVETTTTTPPFIFNGSANTILSWAADNWFVRNEQTTQPGT